MKDNFKSNYLTFNNHELYAELGRHIAFYRKQAHLTQTELARRIEISRPYLCRIESSKHFESLSMEVLFNISRELDIEPYFFFAPLPRTQQASH